MVGQSIPPCIPQWLPRRGESDDTPPLAHRSRNMPNTGFIAKARENFIE
jgi:hypothetical protein